MSGGVNLSTLFFRVLLLDRVSNIPGKQKIIMENPRCFPARSVHSPPAGFRETVTSGLVIGVRPALDLCVFISSIDGFSCVLSNVWFQI